MTSSREEPWAVSFFLGDVEQYIPDDGSYAGKGYFGIVISGGNIHFRENTAVPDYWFETELKIKPYFTLLV